MAKISELDGIGLFKRFCSLVLKSEDYLLSIHLSDDMSGDQSEYELRKSTWRRRP